MRAKAVPRPLPENTHGVTFPHEGARGVVSSPCPRSAAREELVPQAGPPQAAPGSKGQWGEHHCGGIHLSIHLSKRALLTQKGWSLRALPASALWLLGITGCNLLPWGGHAQG